MRADPGRGRAHRPRLPRPAAPAAPGRPPGREPEPRVSRAPPRPARGRRRRGGASSCATSATTAGRRWSARPAACARRGASPSTPASRVVIETAAVGPEGRRRRPSPRADGMPSRPRSSAPATCPCRPTSAAPDRAEDRARYQTVYAREKGSVAAPTAGLHFTRRAAGRAARGGHRHRARSSSTSGPGTFRPVTAEEVEDHRLEPEPYVIPAETADADRGRAHAGAAASSRWAPRCARAGGGGARRRHASRGRAARRALVIVPGLSASAWWTP